VKIAELETKNLDILTGTLIFYRRKVHKIQTHKLTALYSRSSKAVSQSGCTWGKIVWWYAYAKSGKVATDGLTTRSINNLVARLANRLT